MRLNLYLYADQVDTPNVACLRQFAKAKSEDLNKIGTGSLRINPALRNQAEQILSPPIDL